MPQIQFFPTHQTIDVEMHSSLADVCEESNIDLIFGCRQGVCGSCKIKALDSLRTLNPVTEEEHDFLDPDEIKDGIRLACQCLIEGDVRIQLVD